MAWDYTLDDIRQTQAYLLSEVDTITARFRRNDRAGGTGNRVLAPLVVTAVDDSSIITNARSSFNTFIDLPEEFVNSLVPQIKVYKTYQDADGREYNYLLENGSYLGMTPEGKQSIQGVIIKSAEFTRLGGNPAEINTNIKFNLKLFAKDITTFFVKDEKAPIGNFDNNVRANEIAATMAAVSTTAQEIVDIENQIGLTIPNANSILATQDPLTNEEASFLQNARDLNLSLNPLYSRLDALAESISELGPNGERYVSWIDLIKIDPGKDIDTVTDSELLILEKHARIKVEVGYAEPTNPPMGVNIEDVAWNNIKKSISDQKEVFYLSLFKHQFDFDGYNGVNLSIDFIATGNAKLLSPEADLFYDPSLEATIIALEISIERSEAEIELANINEEQSSNFESCITDIEEEIEEAETLIRKYRSVNKLKILNQLYLFQANTNASGRFSRVFERQFVPAPQTDEDEESDSPSSKQQSQVRYLFINDLKVISDNISDTSRGGISDEDLAASEEDAGETITREEYDNGNTADLFIFLGDIIEAAVEILVPGDTENLSVTYRRAAPQVRDDAAFVAARVLLPVSNVGLMLAQLRQHIWNGEREGEKSETPFRPPFAWVQSAPDVEPTAATAASNQRLATALKEFGGILTGKVSYQDPNMVNTGQIKTVNIRDIPIALDIFRSWWINTYVKSGKKTLYLRDFIVALMRFVEKEVFRETPLNHGRVEKRVNDPAFIVNNIPIAPESFAAAFPNNSVSAPLFRQVSRVTAATPLQNGRHTMMIEAVTKNPLTPADVPNIEFGETSLGVLKKINFEREDIPGHAEARLFSDRDSVAGNIALREKYNTSLEMIGNSVFLPGSLLYVNPLPLDLGHSSEKNGFARSLGLGGLYRVVNLTSTLSFDSSGESWYTKVNTKWESFGDGNDGTTAATDPSPLTLGLCVEEEITWLEQKRQYHIDRLEWYQRTYTAETLENGTSNTFSRSDYERTWEEIDRYSRLIENLTAAIAENSQ
tara:strand:+ start:5493 stop:8495 length:3003 start_codon:yes stop_codon:yes gene_type:complete